MEAIKLEKVQELLNEEKWTRAAIENYSKKNFIKLDNIIEESMKNQTAPDLKQTCLEHLKHSSNSLIALYIIGILNYESKALDNNYLNKAINLFRDNKKWSIVEYLAEKILTYEENKRALKALSSVYKNTNMEEELWKTWERLIKVDHNNSEIPKKLAAHYEEENTDLSVYYYKLTLKRLLLQNDLSQIENIWRKLKDLAPDDLYFFLSLELKLKGKLNDESIGNLYFELVPYFKDKNVDTVIQILKLVTKYYPKHKEARAELVDSFKEKYKNHSRLEDTLSLSALDQTWKDIDEALEVFYKNIAFDVNDYIYHRSWKIGKIVAIDGETFTIDFDQKAGHKMDIEMAQKSLTRLTDQHLWIMARKDLKGLQDMAVKNIEEFLKVVLLSFNKEIPLKNFKEEIISNKILTESSWASWWTKARKIFKTNPKFGASTAKKNVYFLRDKPMTFEEETINNFESEKEFDKKLLMFEDFLNHHSDYSSSSFLKMVSYFKSKIDISDKITPVNLESILFLHRLNKQINSAANSIETPQVDSFYSRINDPAHMLEQLVENENKKALSQIIRKYDENWDSVYAKILKQNPSHFHYKILDELILNEKYETVNTFISNVLDHYREDIDHLIWLTRTLLERDERDDGLNINETSIYIALINSLAILNKDIKNKSNVGPNRKKLNYINNFLFRDGKLISFIISNDKETVTKVLNVFHVVSDVLEEQHKSLIMKALKENHPEIGFSFTESEEGDLELHPFLVTQKGYDEKQIEYKHIVEVEIPENSKDISLALEQGDLSENAEYKAALEHQDQLKAKIVHIDSELKNARIINEHDVTLDHIGFANRVKLHNLETKKEELFTILGEWESNPQDGIISYKSPLGNSMLFKKVNEEFVFKVDNKDLKYKVLEIEKAPIF